MVTGNLDKHGSVGAISGCEKLTTTVERLLDRAYLTPPQMELIQCGYRELRQTW